MVFGVIIALLLAVAAVVFLMPNRAYDKKLDREQRGKNEDSED